jgi:hypothetical protein
LQRKSRDLSKSRQRREAKSNPNCMSQILNELMDERLVEQVDIHKYTGIPWSTLNEWVRGKVKVQALDGNLLALARFFNVSIHYLVFGIGEDDPVFGDDNPSLDVKNRKMSYRAGIKKKTIPRLD